jgi:acyl-CoA synthetase (AMP-forming)/AMP-acid ligase II
VRVVDDSEALDEGRVGEVEIRGAGVATGYVKNPEATGAAFADGWFRTGDLGVFVDGHLHLRGRINEVINRGGEKVSPFEVEEVLRSHPAVAEAAAFPRANDRYGEVVEAVVTLGRPATSSELIDHCRGQLAHFKVPAAIHLLDEIPRTATGKIQRRLLASRLAEET